MMPMMRIVILSTILICSQALAQSADVRAAGIGRARPGLSGPQARLMAERAAQISAARNALSAAGLAAFTRRGTAEHIRVDGVIRGHRYSSTRLLPDGSAVATVRAPVAQAQAPEAQALHLRLQNALRAYWDRLKQSAPPAGR